MSRSKAVLPHCLILILCASLLLILPACREARMAVSPDLTAAAPAWPVKGRAIMGMDKPVYFGPYQVTGVRRGWTERFGWGIWVYESLESSQQYEFRLQSAGMKPWQAQCAVNADQQFIQSVLDKGRGEITIELSADSNLVCTFRELLGQKAWHMVLTRKTGQAVLNGWLLGEDNPVEVRGSRALEGSPIKLTEATGYEFRLGGRLVGAVQTMNDGVVWLDPGAPVEYRQAMAAASAALLLHMDVAK